MTCSPAQLAANRRNSQSSTGPRSPDEKLRSRRNSLKHGLTGAGIVLPTEDLAEVEARFDDFEADLRPRGGVARFLTRRAAMLSVRLDRCARHESSMTSERIDRAEAYFDARRLDEAALLYDWIASTPAANARRLHQTPEGVDRLILAWEGLKSDLFHPMPAHWDCFYLEKAENLKGRRPLDQPVPRARALSEAIEGKFQFLEDHEGAGLDPAARRRWARVQMGHLIDAEIAQLQDLRATFDDTETVRGRAQSVDRALFDPSSEAILARKYEAAAERAFYKALRQIKEADAAHDAAEELPDPPTQPHPPPGGPPPGTAPPPPPARPAPPPTPTILSDPNRPAPPRPTHDPKRPDAG